MTRLRLAVSGAGRAFERLYLPAIATSPDFDLVGVADPRRERFAAGPGSAARAGSAAELLERTKQAALTGQFEPFKTAPNFDGVIGRRLHGLS